MIEKKLIGLSITDVMKSLEEMGVCTDDHILLIEDMYWDGFNAQEIADDIEVREVSSEITKDIPSL
tara:strand:+ start:431 stop:628 length:198 start_codon:yes stop_codon:yes gene_type:complete